MSEDCHDGGIQRCTERHYERVTTLKELRKQMIVRIEDPKIFVGLSADDARRQIEGNGYEVRMIKIDGSYNYSVKDYDPLRVNLTIVNNIVSEATIG